MKQGTQSENSYDTQRNWFFRLFSREELVPMIRLGSFSISLSVFLETLMFVIVDKLLAYVRLI